MIKALNRIKQISDIASERQELGHGHFSEVFSTKLQDLSKKIVVSESRARTAACIAEFNTWQRLPISPFLQNFLFVTQHKPHRKISLQADGDLLSFLDQASNISFIDLKQIIGQIVLGLKALVLNNLAHRDLKLENILFYDREYHSVPHIEIADLDSAIKVDNNGKALQKSLVCYTPAYLPSDVRTCLKSGVNCSTFDEIYWNLNHQRLDLYALGIIVSKILDESTEGFIIMSEDDAIVIEDFCSSLLSSDKVTNPRSSDAEVSVSIQTIMEDPLFGETPKERKDFFQSLLLEHKPIAITERTIGSFFMAHRVEPEDHFYISSAKIQDVIVEADNLINKLSFVRGKSFAGIHDIDELNLMSNAIKSNHDKLKRAIENALQSKDSSEDRQKLTSLQTAAEVEVCKAEQCIKKGKYKLASSSETKIGFFGRGKHSPKLQEIPLLPISNP